MAEENNVREEVEDIEREISLEERVNNINHWDEVTLRDTIPLMKSEDYRTRFVAEYMQTKIRYNNLHMMIVKMDAGTLEFEPKCNRMILINQKSFMGQYLNQLEIRAEIEGIPLPRL